MKTKWLFTSLFFLAFCMSAYGIQVSAPDLEAQPGDAITVGISVDDATGIAGADFKLNYDPAILAAKEARLTDLATGLTGIPNLAEGEVTMSIVAVTLEPLAGGSGALIEVDFDVLPDASGVSPLTLAEMFLYDEFAGDLEVEVVNGSVTVAGVEPSPEEANKAIVVREFEEVWNQQNLDVIDEIYGPDNVFHDPAETGFMGPEGYRQFVTMYITAFPDVQFTIEEQIAAGDKVATLWTATGTHQGELMGIPPTDVYAITTGINIAQVVDGQIVEEWAHWDALGQMQQLGVITPARPAPENYMWGAPSGVVGEAGDPEANKAVVMRNIEEVWNQGNLDVLDEISSPDHVGHSPVELTSPMIGIEAAKAGVAVYLAAFPDVELTVEDIFAAGDMVVTRWSSTGTHEGELAGIPPAGEETESTGILMSRVVDGLITDSWWAWDALGLMQQITPPEVPVTEANKALELRIFEEIWNQGAVDVVDEILADDYVIHDPAGEFAGPEGYKQFHAIFYSAFPDLHFTIEEQAAEEDMVVTRWTVTATHTGELMGTPATGAAIVSTGITISQIIDGKIVEEWNSWDILGLMQQIGAIDPAGRDDFLWGEPSVVTGAPGDLEANKALAARYTEEVWNQQNMDAADEIFISDVINHEPVSRPIADILGIPRDVGLEGHKAGIGVYLAAFPDLHGVIDDMIAEGDRVVVRWTATGTHQGEFMGLPPTEKQVTWTGNTMYRFADDKVVEMWWAWDALGLMQQITPPAVPETEANKAIVRRVYDEIWNQGAVEVADELFTPDYAFHGPGVGELSGPEAFKQLVIAYRAAFPDIEWIIEDQIAEGDVVVNRITGTGTHQGEFAGVPPTNEHMSATLISIIRIADGKIQESWNFVDMLGVMQQMGVADAMGRETYVWGPPSEVVGDPGDPEANKVMLERYVEEAWNQQNVDVLDELMNPDMVNHEATLGLLVGVEAHKQGIGAYLIAFPDFNCVIDDIIAEGDKVVTRWTCTGTHQGELVGIPPSGKQATWTGSTISRIADGKVVEMWWAWDALGLVQQITPPTEPEPALPEVILAMLAVSDGAINSQDPDLLVSFSADDLVFDYVPTPPPIEGKEAVKEYFAEVFQTFPDLSVTLIRPSLVAGNIAVVEHIMTGTHLGELDLGPLGTVPPTGESFQTMHMDIWEFEGDEAKKTITYDDTASQLVQLGILPAPEPIDPTTLVPSFTLPEPVPTDMTVMEISEELAARYSAHDAAGLAEMISPDAEVTMPTFPMPISRDAFIASMEMMDFVGFPDIVAETVRTVDMGDGWALAERVFKGTHGGPYLGVEATGLPVELRAGILFRIDEDGLITNFYGYWDNLTVMAQLGLLEPEPPAKDYSNEFFMSLTSGLNMISLPLEPVEPYTARSFAEEIGATLVIRYDEVLKKFDGFALNAPGDGFILEGGRGYIVNMLESKVVAFTGAAWANEPPAEAAPPAAQSISAWAFLVNGTVLDSEDMSLSDSDYTVVVKNLRTGAVADETVGEGGYFAAVWADLNRKAVVEAGDKVEVAVVDSSGKVVSGPFVHDVTLDGIRNALVKVQLRLGHIIPEKSVLLQNYPNPFNPETWIPFHLKGEGSVSIRIFSLSGQLIKTLDLGHKDAGVYVSRTKAAYWDGKNEAGEEVSSGIYFYSINAGDFSSTRKMIIRK